jgi:hypothetical protein
MLCDATDEIFVLDMLRRDNTKEVSLSTVGKTTVSI